MSDINLSSNTSEDFEPIMASAKLGNLNFLNSSDEVSASIDTPRPNNNKEQIRPPPQLPSSSSQSIILTNGAGVNNPHSARIYPLPITTSTTTPTTTANNGFESRRTNIPSNHNGLLVVEHLQ